MAEPTAYIDPNQVDNQQALKEDDDFAICLLCKGIIQNPMQCLKCKSFFCAHCLETYKQSNETCPNQCKPFNTSQADIVIQTYQIDERKINQSTIGLFQCCIPNKQFSIKY